jgi:aerobic-type carbon monoxide dehydrogenase small subunit (CoxS/CutS family)
MAITRREWFQSVAFVGGLVPATSLFKTFAAPPKVPLLGPGKIKIQLTVNGQVRALEIEPRTTLLEALRDHLALTGAKPVCDRGACGACTVHLDGDAVCSCMLLALDARGRSITTVEGLEHKGKLAPIQEAFIEHDALQCGFCTPGMIMSCQALLGHNPQPTLDDVKAAVAGNLCRCGTYPKVFAATMAAARKERHG